jgi:hypothetical protein
VHYYVADTYEKCSICSRPFERASENARHPQGVVLTALWSLVAVCTLSARQSVRLVSSAVNVTRYLSA